jgi:mannose-6-phosphate isomerase-like protein (cupin superfamily)
MQIPHGDAVYRVEPGQVPDYATQNPLVRLLGVVEGTRLAADRENYAPETLHYLLPHTWLALYGPSAPNTDVLDPTAQDFKTDFQKQNVADFRLGDTRVVRGMAYAFDWTGPFLQLSYRAGPDSALSQAAGHRLGDRLVVHVQVEGGGEAELTAPYDPGSDRYVVEVWGAPDDLRGSLGPRGQESLDRGVLQIDRNLARGVHDAFAREALEGRDVRELAPDHLLHPTRPLRLRVQWRAADGSASDPADGRLPLAFEMVVRGWDSYLSVGRSPNPHGGVGTLEYRNLLSNYFAFEGSGELGRGLEGWNLDASGRKARPGQAESFLAVDYMDLHLMDPACGIGLHRHRDNSEAFLMLDGEGWMVIGDWADTGRRARCFEVRLLRSGHLALLKGGNLHGLSNPGAGRAALFMFGGYD